MPDWNHVHAELRRRGVTLLLLWEEYRAGHPDGYGYSRFCDLYIDWRRGVSATMRQTHVAGEKLFVDYAGDTVPVFDGATGEERPAHIFVAVLGASNYTYAEARWSEGLADWIGAHVNALAFLGGAPKLLVCDNGRPVGTNPGVINKDVDTAECLFGTRHHLGHRPHVRNVSHRFKRLSSFRTHHAARFAYALKRDVVRRAPSRLAGEIDPRGRCRDQVLNNHESRRRQYGLVERARALGWNAVEVIDDDLGRSSSGIARPGFEKLLAAICEGRVGPWCRSRPREALRQKARRGELFLTVAVGFLKASNDRIEKDPDRRIQDAISLVSPSSTNCRLCARSTCGCARSGCRCPASVMASQAGTSPGSCLSTTRSTTC